MLVNSDCSSGCESGWTLYFENSYNIVPRNPCKGDTFCQLKGDFSEVAEDLSMVSDASSGPPLHTEEQECGNHENDCSYYAPIDAKLPKRIAKRKKNNENLYRNLKEQQPSSALEDTASSPIFNNQAPVHNVLLDFSEGYSTTHFQVL